MSFLANVVYALGFLGAVYHLSLYNTNVAIAFALYSGAMIVGKWAQAYYMSSVIFASINKDSDDEQ